jgi:hypothetical protein
MNAANQFALSPPIAMLAVVGLFAWMLFRPKSTAPAKIFLFILAVLLFGPVSIAVMDAENAAFPFKFDFHLFLLDRTVGISAFSIARHFSARLRDVLFVAYETLGYWMIVWYGLNLALKHGKPKQFATACAIAYGLAPLFYLAVPACGPRHAFGAVFPMGSPEVAAVPVRLVYWPNAIPSLHLATAILLVYFAARQPILRCFSWVYLASTVASTLAFEHYLIDLVVAVPYAYFAVRAAEGRFRESLRNMAVVLVWLGAIRFATPQIIHFPVLLRLLSLATIVGPAVSSHRVFGPPSRAASPVPSSVPLAYACSSETLIQSRGRQRD